MSTDYFNKLVAAYIFTNIQYVANAGHEFAGNNTNSDYEQIAQTAVQFLNVHVKNNANPSPQ